MALGLNVGQVVPHAHQMRHAERIKHGEDLAISKFRRAL